MQAAQTIIGCIIYFLEEPDSMWNRLCICSQPGSGVEEEEQAIYKEIAFTSSR